MRPGPTARTIAMRDSLEPNPTTEFVSDGIHSRACAELISIVAATSVYAPAPIAIDPFVEDSHLVGLFVRR